MRRHVLWVTACAFLSVGQSATAADAPIDTSAVAKENNRFAFDLYAQLRSREGNLFLSPASISTALAMTYAGAGNDTARQMASTLHFTLEPERLHSAFASLIKGWSGDGSKRPYQLSVANSLWGQKNFGFRDDFLKLTRDHYGAGLQEVDFAATEEARRLINSWAEKETQGKIKDVLQPGDVDSFTRLVLANAIYFKGDWAYQFKKDDTRPGPFHVAAGKDVNAQIMHQTRDFAHFDGDTFQVLEMPYAGKDLSMVIVLPRKIDGLAELEKTLTVDKLSEWLGKLRAEKVAVSLPRFKMTTRFKLSQQLAALGMRDAFVPGKADFSGMTSSKSPLSISEVIHQAFVDVNEQGTEAAAVTAVAVRAPSPPMPNFRADHPFLFLIRDTRTNSVLFMGRVVDPS